MFFFSQQRKKVHELHDEMWHVKNTKHNVFSVTGRYYNSLFIDHIKTAESMETYPKPSQTSKSSIRKDLKELGNLLNVAQSLPQPSSAAHSFLIASMN
jgi:hypothetical protein